MDRGRATRLPWPIHLALPHPSISTGYTRAARTEDPGTKHHTPSPHSRLISRTHRDERAENSKKLPQRQAVGGCALLAKCTSSTRLDSTHMAASALHVGGVAEAVLTVAVTAVTAVMAAAVQSHRRLVVVVVGVDPAHTLPLPPPPPAYFCCQTGRGGGG